MTACLDHCTDYFLQSIIGCNNVTTMSALHWWLSGAENTQTDWSRNQSPPLVGPHPEMGWVKLDGGSWCQSQAMQSRTLQAHTLPSANGRPVFWTTDQWWGGTAAGSDVPSVTCLPRVWVCTGASHLSTISDFRPKTDPRAQCIRRWLPTLFILNDYPNLECKWLMNYSENPWKCLLSRSKLNWEILEVARLAEPFTLTVFMVHYFHYINNYSF